MTTSTHQTNKAASQVMYLTEVAETLCHDALAHARAKLNPRDRDLPLEKLFERADFGDYFKYELALGVAAVLGTNDQRVEATYFYDPSANPDSEASVEMPFDPTIYLLVKVSTSSAALEMLVSSLDRALTANLLRLPSPHFTHRESALDVILVSAQDVKNGRGYGALLRSVFAPPLRIWEREG